MQKHEKFLEFNGKKILFKSKDGTYWIALRPICEALHIDVRRARENVKNDLILGSVVSKQTLQTTVFRKDLGSVNQAKSMTCLPEKYIYGWIFSIRSESKELIEYKRTCYELLYNHFHGTITNRKEVLMERNSIDGEMHVLKEKLAEEEEAYKRLKYLEKKRRAVNQQLQNIDKDLMRQGNLFSDY